ncbi:acyl-CoA dehydrogenase C-terminal domain-containing protein [soil metagenome]
MDYRPETGDIQFILEEVLQNSAQLTQLSPFAAVDADLMHQVLDEAARFVEGHIAPLQRVGDIEGCRLHGGAVTTPDGFSEAYAAFWQSGWASLSCAAEDGGQGLPEVLNQALYEMLSAANHAWTMAPGLLHGAYECLRLHGGAALKEAFLGRIASGEWLATMCLTEAHAGSDLGQVRTRAEPETQPLDDDAALGPTYRIRGTKIFISGGEHDLTSNIVHLVLARLPDAPAGPKGLSLLLAPKYLSGQRRNTIVCERIEEKMGLHGSPTCVMRFDDAIGWLVGEPGQGLAAMFVMMNASRLHVGLQGIGLLGAAWQKAEAYARERRQMRVPGPRGTGPSAGADLIIGHPAIQRILQTQRAWIDGGRVVAYQTAIELDIARHHADPARREAAQRWCALVTPVVKAAFTDQAFRGASDCLQVFGGHGYISEWGIEQIVRDARITMIYEGTNEIQAIDLLVRKVQADKAVGFGRLLDLLCEDLQAGVEQGGQPGAASGVAMEMAGALKVSTSSLLQRSTASADVLYWVAGDFLMATALVFIAWAWARIDRTDGGANERWAVPAAAFRAWILPEFEMRLKMLGGVATGCEEPGPENRS